MIARPSPDVYFMRIANGAAARATCPRRHVGCVLVRDGDMLATGYNGSIRGRPHCDEVGCLMINEHCERTLHAEANAIISAARRGVRVEGATAYVTSYPCWSCFKTLANAGIVRVVFGSPYKDRDGDIVRPEAELLGIVEPAAAR